MCGERLRLEMWFAVVKMSFSMVFSFIPLAMFHRELSSEKKARNTFFRKRIKKYEGRANLTPKIRQESGAFTTVEYSGNVRFDGSDYMKEALPSLLMTGYDWKRNYSLEYWC